MENVYGGGVYNIRTAHGTYLRVHPGGDGSKVDTASIAAGWECFLLVQMEPGKNALRSAHGTYLRVHPGGDGSNVDTASIAAVWECFTFERVSRVTLYHGTDGLNAPSMLEDSAPACTSLPTKAQPVPLQSSGPSNTTA